MVPGPEEIWKRAAGYGLGFDRLVCYVAAIPGTSGTRSRHPQYPGSAQF